MMLHYYSYVTTNKGRRHTPRGGGIYSGLIPLIPIPRNLFFIFFAPVNTTSLREHFLVDYQ